MYQCFLCQKWVSLSLMAVHMRGHFEVKERKCDDCIEGFNLKTRKEIRNLSNLNVIDENGFEDETFIVDFPYGWKTYHRKLFCFKFFRLFSFVCLTFRSLNHFKPFTLTQIKS